jgi:long-chain fatty acid transport protein
MANRGDILLSKSSRIQARILLGGMAAILLGTCDLAQAGGYYVSAVGDRARAMGGAFTGLADDWTAVHYNPAGGAWVLRSQVVGNAMVLSPRLNYTPDTLTFGGWRVNNKTYGEYYNTDHTIVMPQLGGYARISGGGAVSMGFGFYTQAVNNLVWDLYAPFYKTNEEFPGPDTRSDIRTWTASPTIAIKLQDRLSLGAGLLVTRAEMEQQRVMLTPDPGIPFNLPPYPVGMAMVDQTLNGSGWGVGYNLGVMLKMTSFSVGAVFQSTVVHKLSGETTTNFWSQKVEGRGEQTDPLIEQDLLAGKKHAAVQDVEFDLTLPPYVTLGLAFFPSDKLRFTTDLTQTFYSEVPGIIATKGDSVTFKFGDPLAQSTEVTVQTTERYQWQDQFRIAAGMEWDASARFHFRAGAYYEPAMVEASSMTPLNWDPSSKISPSAGVSFDLGEHWNLGYAYGAVLHEDRTTGEATSYNQPGRYGGMRHESFVSFGYRW